MITQRTAACDAMPAFEAALAAGLIAAGHVDIVARSLCKLDDQLRLAFIEREGGCSGGPTGNGSRSSRSRVATRSVA